MTSLVAMLTTGKGGWARVSELMNIADWDKIYLVSNSFGAGKFTHKKNFEFVVFDDKKDASGIRDEIMKGLKGKISGTEVALNLASGTGDEHMAVVSAVLRLGFGFRIVEVKDKKLIDLTMHYAPLEDE